jgi:hypothetical protein
VFKGKGGDQSGETDKVRGGSRLAAEAGWWRVGGDVIGRTAHDETVDGVERASQHAGQMAMRSFVPDSPSAPRRAALRSHGGGGVALAMVVSAHTAMAEVTHVGGGNALVVATRWWWRWWWRRGGRFGR